MMATTSKREYTQLHVFTQSSVGLCLLLEDEIMKLL